MSLLELDFGGEDEKPPALTAQQMRLALYRHYVGQYAVLFEVSTDMRQEAAAPGGLRRRAIDVLLVRRARRRGIEGTGNARDRDQGEPLRLPR